MAPRAAQPLALFETPLDGVSLVEASAGTGKTWTIAGLYLRLVVEAGLGPEAILVVTYTKAATAELRTRIRERLVLARAALASGASQDPLCLELLARCTDRDAAERAVTHAVRGFDEAAVYTIHGFCQRVLSERAFQSAAPFEAEVTADESELLREVARDFWRREIYRADPLFAGFLVERTGGPDGLLDAVAGHLGRPYLEVRGAPPPADPAPLLDAHARAYRATRALWRGEGEAVRALLEDSPGLNRNRYRAASVRAWLAELEAFLEPEAAHLARCESLAKFTPGSLAAGTKAGFGAPAHPLFEACADLLAARDGLSAHFEQALAALRARALAWCDGELRTRKRRARLQSYNDLLNDLHAALAGSGGARLADALRARYPAALIDEFQDTDPVQYGIFRRIYGGGGRAAFLVGDPKQAIYSFRGADVYAYLEGRRDAARAYTLDTNWRSDPPLVGAVNALFGAIPRPFFLDAIPFHPVRAAAREREVLHVAGDPAASLRLWQIPRAEDGEPLAKHRAMALVARATAGEIARLLGLAARGQARLGARALGGGDLAVLVRTHRQGLAVRDALADLGVASVQYSQESVFHAPEAEALERVLLAVAEPGQGARVRAALATDLLGLDGMALARLTEDEVVWEEWVERFHGYRAQWQAHGFMRMLRALVAREGVARRLLALADGERRLTNLMHLAELLQGEALRRAGGVEALVAWLAERRGARPGDAEAEQLRLESDAERVKIVTVHKSKGLEYPVVFYPFAWHAGLREGGAAAAFHDPDADHRPVLDLGSPGFDAAAARAREEAFAEGLRLLYVALTRARHRCYLAWGPVNGAEQAALAWLLHAPPPGPGDPLARLAAHFGALDDAALAADLAALAARAGGALSVEPIPPGAGAPYRAPRPRAGALAARVPGRSVPEPWRIASYSALVTGHGAERPDHDAVPPAPPAPAAAPPARDVFAFPRGARAGSCLHEVFERWDFTAPRGGELAACAARVLARHGFESDWAPVVADLVGAVLDTPLAASADLRLAAIPRARRLDELEFHYPLAGLRAPELTALLGEHGAGPGPGAADDVPGLHFAPTRGYMKGFIDLVFEHGGRYFLADYKSNWLGGAPEDYAAEHLPAVMGREAYTLQYLLYTVALHRHLRARLAGYRYAEHFGGVFYLFLRGMRPALGARSGVFAARPAQALVEALDRYFATGRIGG